MNLQAFLLSADNFTIYSGELWRIELQLVCNITISTARKQYISDVYDSRNYHCGEVCCNDLK